MGRPAAANKNKKLDKKSLGNFSEPRRLASRYFRWNSLFLWYLFWDGLRGRAVNRPAPAPAQ